MYATPLTAKKLAIMSSSKLLTNSPLRVRGSASLDVPRVLCPVGELEWLPGTPPEKDVIISMMALAFRGSAIIRARIPSRALV